MTFATLKTIIRDLLDEATAALYTDDDLEEWINAAERDIAAQTGCLEVSVSLVTTIGSRVVPFEGEYVSYLGYAPGGATPLVADGGVFWQDEQGNVWTDTEDNSWGDNPSNSWIPVPVVGMKRITLPQLNHIPLRGEVVPRYWLQWGNNIIIEPVPQAEYDLTALVVQLPSNSMSDDADEPEIPEEFHSAIIPYVVMMGDFKNRKYGDGARRYQEYISLLAMLTELYVSQRATLFREIRLPDEVRRQ